MFLIAACVTLVLTTGYFVIILIGRVLYPSYLFSPKRINKIFFEDQSNMNITRYKLHPQQQKMLENNLLEDEKVLKVGEKMDFKSNLKTPIFLFYFIFTIPLLLLPFTMNFFIYTTSKNFSSSDLDFLIGFSIYFFVIPSLLLLRLTYNAYRFSFNYVITNKRLISISPGIFIFFIFIFIFIFLFF